LLFVLIFLILVLVGQLDIFKLDNPKLGNILMKMFYFSMQKVGF